MRMDVDRWVCVLKVPVQEELRRMAELFPHLGKLPRWDVESITAGLSVFYSHNLSRARSRVIGTAITAICYCTDFSTTTCQGHLCGAS